jgi:photosystem II stability/assembly factor-like uncharacterized protein
VRGRAVEGFTICVGTINAGLWHSDDGGASWGLARFAGAKYPGELDVRAVAASPHDPAEFWATSSGEPGATVLLRSRDGGRSFDPVGKPLTSTDVWSIAISPHDENLVVLGTRPAQLLRSVDCGESWETLPLGAAPECSIGPTRMTTVTFNRARPGEIWCGAEIAGIFHSEDNGSSWEHLICSGGESLLGEGEVWTDERHSDIHDLAIQAGDSGSQVFVATPIGLFTTSDVGQHWASTRYCFGNEFDRSIFYTRSVATKADDDNVVIVGLGRRPPDHGTMGGLQQSIDGGRTWRPASPLLRSVVWALTSHPDMANTFVGATLYGQIVRSLDGGQSFQVLEREFGETRSVAISPRST